MEAAADDYDISVFINCPFDSSYDPLFNAIVFAVHDCGFIPRCAKEFQGSKGDILEKICDAIGECRYGVHDISHIVRHSIP